MFPNHLRCAIAAEVACRGGEGRWLAQGVWLLPCAGPGSDTHRACATRAHRGSAWKRGRRVSLAPARWSLWVRNFLRREGRAGSPLSLPRPLLLFEVFLSSLPLPVCTAMPPRGTVGTAALPCRLEAVPRQSITNSGRCCRPCLSHSPAFHLSAHPCPRLANPALSAALFSSSHHPKVPGRGSGLSVRAGTLCGCELAVFTGTFLSRSHAVTPSLGGHSSAMLSTESVPEQAGWHCRASPCQRIPRSYHSYLVLCRLRSPASAAPQAAQQLQHTGSDRARASCPESLGPQPGVQRCSRRHRGA